MSKKYKRKGCAYCGKPGSSAGPDHVVARKFFLERHRSNLPQVPACWVCNGRKAALEHYLTALLPFGGRHPLASETLGTLVPDRLTKNRALQRSLAEGTRRVWTRTPAGLSTPAMALPVRPEAVIELFALIVRGLMSHHWSVHLTPDHDVTVIALATAGEEIFDELLVGEAVRRLNESLGEGTFVYEAAQGVDLPEISVWRLSMYGVQFSDPESPNEIATRFGVLTGPSEIPRNAERRVRFGM